MEPVLEIYVAKHCLGTPEALRLAGEVAELMPRFRLKLRVIDDMPAAETDFIFATPSYYLNGSLLFLGNPGLDELVERLLAVSGTFNEGNAHEQS